MLVSYPRATLNGQPKIAPAATPSTAMEVLSIYQPVMAINVVYIQKLLGRNADDEQNMPVLRTKKASIIRLTCNPNFLHTAL